MDREQKIAYINSQTVCAQAELSGMEAENAQREHRGESMAYDEDAFMDIPVKYGITHNQVLECFMD